MHQNESVPARTVRQAPPPHFAELKAEEKWSAMEQHMSHPLLQFLRAARTGTLRLYMPDGSEVFYLGTNPGVHANMRFLDWPVLDRLARGGDAAWGEEFARGHWQTSDLRKLMRFLAENFGHVTPLEHANPLFRLAQKARRKLFASADRPPQPLHPEYDLAGVSNDFFALWLDETMSLSGAMFQGDPELPLEAAQRLKCRRILERFSPQPGQRVLDIGCGWGAFAEEAARKNVQVTGVTLCGPQAAWAQRRLEGFANLAEIKLEDFRQVDGKYDYAVSAGMLEHIGEESWPDFMDCLFRNLAPGGKAIVQTPVISDDLFEAYRLRQDFARLHIFPRSLIPSRRRLEQEATRAGLRLEHALHFGKDYGITFGRWLARFEANADRIRELGYCEKYVRKWRYYLASQAALFDAGRFDAVQLELTRPRAT